MKEIILRYKVVGIQRCQTCGHVEIQSILHGGTSEDPAERPPHVDAPDPRDVIQPRTGGEQITRMIEDSLRATFPFMDPQNIQRTPGGALITLGPRMRKGASHRLSRRMWNLALTKEEYELIAPITIGDILTQKISMEEEG